MPAWSLFAAVAILVTVGFVVLARATARTLREPSTGIWPPPAPDESTSAPADGGAEPERWTDPGPPDESVPGLDAPSTVSSSAAVLDSTPLLLANVLATHGVLAVVLLAAAWLTAVPPDALGLEVPSTSSIAIGGALGLVLAVANEAGARVADRLGFEPDDRLRDVLAPDTVAGWTGLLLVGLPVIAGAEELLFRGVLIGGLSSGLGWSIPLLIGLSSAVFGLGHGLQGPGGVLVTALLGAVLGVAFVTTGSLAVVVVAHYTVNAAEFLAHEGPLVGD